jgi:hypothetical protein
MNLIDRYNLTNPYSNNKAQQEVIDWVLGHNVALPYAVTLTFPHATLFHNADIMFEKFHKHLNRIYYRRQPSESIKHFSVIHQANNPHNIHCHIAFAKPKHITDLDFDRRIRKVWKKVIRSKRVRTHFEYKGLQWIGYLTKEFKCDYTQGFCPYTNLS